ncbi:hypothetical protein [Actinoplanes sp. NPDC026623]|uniref:hypothetical protein n=1 Tax=Actinoplanes sp. NPDC026623 TaxID=3155610 RepID=UPI0034012490
MSDFDAVLERLLTDPSFQALLAADPAGALDGYRLEAGEAELLRQQVSADPGASAAAVEDRVSKSSTFGLFSSFGGLGGASDSFGSGGARQGFGSAPVAAGPGSARDSLGEWSEFGTAAGAAARGAVGYPASEGFGSAPDAWGAGGGDLAARSGLGSAPGLEDAPDLDGLPAVSRLGDAPRSGFGDAFQKVGEALGGPGKGQGEAEHLAPPSGYHNQVDADGDGHLDKATYRGHEGGGAEIRVDLNHDGRADFVGVDKDLDNRVDYADYDKDHDGVFEKRMFDDDGDGWLDRTVLQ